MGTLMNIHSLKPISGATFAPLSPKDNGTIQLSQGREKGVSLVSQECMASTVFAMLAVGIQIVVGSIVFAMGILITMSTINTLWFALRKMKALDASNEKTDKIDAVREHCLPETNEANADAEEE